MPRRANTRENAKIIELLGQGMTPNLVFNEMKARRMPVPLHRVNYYAAKYRKNASQGTPAPVTEPIFTGASALDQKILFTKKILDSNLDRSLRVKLAQEILSSTT